MKVHHTTETGKICTICNKPILMYWKDKEELNGRSDITQERKDGIVHFRCVPGAKSLQQLNKEREQASKTKQHGSRTI